MPQSQTSAEEPSRQNPYHQLRADLISGYLSPDRKLQISGLAERYETSIGPIREALSYLAAEGLVIRKGQRGYWASEMSTTEFADVSRLRVILECDALEQSISRGDLNWESRVVAALHRVKTTLANTSDSSNMSSDELIRENRAFHMTLISACGSQRQIDFISSLYDQAERFRRHTILDHTEVQQEYEEHKKLMEAALTRDASSACTLLGKHVSEYCSRIATSFTTQSNDQSEEN